MMHTQGDNQQWLLVQLHNTSNIRIDPEWHKHVYPMGNNVCKSGYNIVYMAYTVSLARDMISIYEGDSYFQFNLRRLTLWIEY